jgi:hypothetical protein
MYRRLAPIAATLLVLTACSSEDPDSSAAPEPSAATTAAETAASPLEGTWTTDLTREAVIAYVRENGWSKQVEKALLSPDMAGPEETEFRLDFVGDRFRMAQVATDSQWQAGTYRIEDGVLFLDDEAPVGEATLSMHLDGDTVTFDDPGFTTDPQEEEEFMDGAPAWAPGGVMWGATAWERSDG